MSPAFRTRMVSPMRTSSCRMKSSLCRMARATVVPASCTGSKIAVGVNTPVRPTVMRMSFSTVSFSSGGYLNAMAHRGEFVGTAHHFPLIKPVCFDHRAVNVIGQLAARLADPLNFPNGILDVAEPSITGRHGEPQALQIMPAFMMAGSGFCPHLLHIKHKNGQPTPRRDFAVFLPKGTGPLHCADS